jgi:NOL1/NOP2/sun family putative RNA methylase
MTEARSSEWFPAAWVERMRSMLGDELDLFLEALADPPRGLRVNTLRVAPERFRHESPFELEPLGYPPEGFLVRGDSRPGKHPLHAAGVFYLQDPGAMVVGGMVDPGPGERVLDLAAAPGGKSTHMAARMRNQGVLIANDVHRQRAQELASNMERCGVTNALVTSVSADRLVQQFGSSFDRVLLDAPCSGESMFHKSRAARVDWSPAAVAGCATRQHELMPKAAALVRPGGTLVYSTCTFSSEENEEVVSAFQESCPEFELVPPPAVPGASPGRMGEQPGAAPPDHTVRLWPHRVPGAGHFVAIFRRRNQEDAVPVTPWEPNAPGEAIRLLRSFLMEALPEVEIDQDRILIRGTELFQLPRGAPEMRGVNVVRPGLWLGTVHPRRFEPSHALALAVEPTEAAARLDLEMDDQRVKRFLTGHTVESSGPSGWVIVSAGGFALGWGKRVGSTVKNHFPKGLRWRG